MKKTTKQATYVDKQKNYAITFDYTITNDFETWLEAEAIFGKENAFSRYNAYEDYHGCRGSARRRGVEAIEDAIAEGKLDYSSEAEVVRLLQSLDIEVTHGQQPLKCDETKGEALYKAYEAEPERGSVRFLEQANIVGSSVPKKGVWTLQDCILLAQASRLFKKRLTVDPLSDF